MSYVQWKELLLKHVTMQRKCFAKFNLIAVSRFEEDEIVMFLPQNYEMLTLCFRKCDKVKVLDIIIY